MHTKTILAIAGMVFVVSIGFVVLQKDGVFNNAPHSSPVLPVDVYEPYPNIVATSTTTSPPATYTDPNTAPTLSFESALPPAVRIKYTNLPLANIRLLDNRGRPVHKDIAGSQGTGVMTAIVPAVQFVAGVYTAQAVDTQGKIWATSAPLYIENPVGDLRLGYDALSFPPITSVPKAVAQGLCGVVFGNSCVWDGVPIGEKPFYLFGKAQDQTRLSVLTPSDGQILTMGKTYTISFTNDWAAGRYRAYLVYRNLIGEVRDVHQLHIIKTYEGANFTQNLVWDLNQESLDENGGTYIEPVEQGTYELVVVNVDTGVEGSVPGAIQIRPKNYVAPSGAFKAYAANTPLAQTRWDGRGVFVDGKEGEDSLQMWGKRSDFVIYRGTDMPQKGEYDTVVFFRRLDNVVIIMVNTEIVKFDDQTIRTEDLIAQLR